MLPSSERLLLGVRSTLQRIAAGVNDAHTKRELDAIDVILGELLQRRDAEFFRSQYAELLSLIDEGIELARDRAEVATLAQISVARAALPALLSADLQADLLGKRINDALRCLERLVHAARGDVPADVAAFVSRVVAQENVLQAHHVSAAATAPVTQPAYTRFTAQSMEDYLRGRFPERRGLHVVQLRHLVGGYQKITAMFDIADDSGKRESLVLRSEKDDRFITLDAGNVVDEFDVVRVAYDAGVPVAEPLWLETDASKLGHRFFVSRKMPGESYGSAIGAERVIDRQIARSFVETLARIQQIPTRALRGTALARWLEFATLEENTYANVCYWMNQPWMRTANPSPTYVRLTTWLLDNVPRDVDEPRLTHGDYGPHNSLVHDGRVSAVLDWEAAHIGDQAEDLSWLLQSCSGRLSMQDALDWYEEFTGWRISEYRLRYFTVFNSLKILTGANCVGPMFETLPQASIEWCNIPFRWAPFSASQVEAQIVAAEAVKPKHRNSIKNIVRERTS